MPSSVLGAAGVEARLGADAAAELLGLAARIYGANQADVPVLANRVIACALALGGAVSTQLATQAGKTPKLARRSGQGDIRVDRKTHVGIQAGRSLQAVWRP
jgi:hypothetical protein